MAALDEQVAGDHYKNMAIQPIQFITSNNIPYCEGNIIKYLCRWRSKGGVSDLKKAKHYLDLLIESQPCSRIPGSVADVILPPIDRDMRCM